MQNKKALSAVVSTILLVLLGISAVAIFWFYIQGSLVSFSSQVKTECVTLHLEPGTCIINPDDSLSIILNRNPGSEKVTLTKAKLLLSFKDGTSEIKEINNIPSTISENIVLAPISKVELNNKEVRSVRASAVIEYKDKVGVCELSKNEVSCSRERVVDEGSPTVTPLLCKGDSSWTTLPTWLEDDFTSPFINKFWNDDIKNNWIYSPEATDKKSDTITDDKGYIDLKLIGYSQVAKIKGNFIIEIGYTINDYNSLGGFYLTQDFSENLFSFKGFGFSLEPGPSIGGHDQYYIKSLRSNFPIFFPSFPISANAVPKRLDLRLTVKKNIQNGNYEGNDVIWEYRGLFDNSHYNDPTIWNTIGQQNIPIDNYLDLNNDVDIRFKRAPGMFIRYVRFQSEEGLLCS
ncbi:MAG: hypothetical protein Q7S27_00325 [Nanoarchaeota archaeon]|nr:hypothetical protein [Nanoarchaeota archaeon]